MNISSSRAITTSDLSDRAYGLIADLAQRYGRGKSHIAKAIVEGTSAEHAEKIIAACCAKPEKPRGRQRVIRSQLMKGVERTREIAKSRGYSVMSRRQDDICREIHGEIPMGMHCGYPNCRCRG